MIENEDYKDLAEFYQLRYYVYQDRYNEQLETHKIIMQLTGFIVNTSFEIELYKKRHHGKNSKAIKEKEESLRLLESSIKYFDNISNENFRKKFVINKLLHEKEEYNNRIKELELQVKVLEELNER